MRYTTCDKRLSCISDVLSMSNEISDVEFKIRGGQTWVVACLASPPIPEPRFSASFAARLDAIFVLIRRSLSAHASSLKIGE